jgi:hypothetical protein
VTDIDALIAAEDAELAAEAKRLLAPLALGHIYVVEFGSGVVKVGRGTDPKGRVAAHTRLAEVHGGTVRSVWISRELVGYRSAERSLLRLCARHGAPVVGREYFAIDFRTVRNLASIVEVNSLPGAGLPADDRAFLLGEHVTEAA